MRLILLVASWPFRVMVGVMGFDKKPLNAQHPFADVIQAVEKLVVENGADKPMGSEGDQVHTWGTLLEELKKETSFGAAYAQYWRSKNVK